MADGVRYEHDEDGNQTLKSGPDGDWHYRWNGHGMLREVERPDGIRVAFEYDPFARRTVKRTLSATGTIDREVDFVWDGHNVIHELDSDRGLISWQWEPESFTPIAKEHAGRRWTIASDHLGTPTEMYDDLGQLAWKMQLDVFGVPRFEAGGAEDCPWRWPGQYEDRGTGLFYNQARYYDCATSLYVSNDPLLLWGNWPASGYASDPTTQFDPFGLSVTYWLEMAMAADSRAVPAGHTAHHIVQREGGGTWGDRARAVLDRNLSPPPGAPPHVTAVDNAANGVALWGTHPDQVTVPGHPGRGVSGARPPGYHGGSGIHGPAAMERIGRILERAERMGMDVDSVLRQIGERQRTGTWCR
jgi:RHS repeat-associated protein